MDHVLAVALHRYIRYREMTAGERVSLVAAQNVQRLAWWRGVKTMANPIALGFPIRDGLLEPLPVDKAREHMHALGTAEIEAYARFCDFIERYSVGEVERFTVVSVL